MAKKVRVSLGGVKTYPVPQEIGDLDDLVTTDKSSVVGAINEVAGGVNALSAKNTEALDKNWLNMNCIRNGNGVKFIRCSTAPNAAMNAGTTYNVGTLSVNFRPTYQVSQALIVNAGSNIIGILTITTAGVVTFTPQSAISASTGININLAFI